MNRELLRPHYPCDPFGSLLNLARPLRESPATLLSIAQAPRGYYRRIPIKRKGKVRETWDALAPLKSIQARIQCLILRKVMYPRYLQGGIRDKEQARDFVSNASLHCHRRIVISEDIENFFPSVSSDLIRDLWISLFHFPDRIAHVLTGLTTLEGYLPQGAKTSSYLANLALWRTEPGLVESLRRQGFTYSRYVDDITLSTDRRLTGSEISKVVRQIARMCSPLGFRLKRSKHSVTTSGNRMSTTGLMVNRRASLPKEVRSQTRALVYQCERLANTSKAMRQTPQYAVKWRRASGKVALLQRLHATLGSLLRERLRAIKPISLQEIEHGAQTREGVPAIVEG